ncbi:MAG: glycosyltransferase [Bacteroidales bacterium]
MRILQIINNLGSGGAEKLISEFVPVMRDRGHHVEVLLLQRNGSLYIDYLERAGIKVTVLSESSLYSLKHVWNIRNYIRKGKFDVVHVHIFPSLYFAGLAAFFGIGRAKLVFTEHNTTNKRMESRLFAIADKLIYLRYKHVISITPEVCKNICRHLIGVNCKHTVVLNGINLSLYDLPVKLTRSDLNIPNIDDSSKLITMVGRFSEQKDQATLIKAMVNLPESAHLLLLGEGPLRGQLEELVDSLDLGNRVHFLGFRSDIPDVLRISDIGVLSSNWEGMPISAIEIMAAGIPFVGSRVPGIKDLVESKDDGAGILFECGNSDELAEKLISILSDKSYHNSVAIACKIRSEVYSVERMVDGYLGVYKI